MSSSSQSSPSRAKPLVLAILCVLGAGSLADAAETTPARGSMLQAGETRVVQNCNDAGPGSLRDIVDHVAVSGDVIDMTQLTCGTISLEAGAITVAQDELTLLGPGASNLTIDAGHASQVLVHTSWQGVLFLNDFTVGNGHVQVVGGGVARGGCILSESVLALEGMVVHNCTARADGFGAAKGGGVYARGMLHAGRSTIADNTAVGGGTVQGGGVFVSGRAVFENATIDGNKATRDGGVGMGGGAFVSGGGGLVRSTVSNNRAGDAGGIVFGDVTGGTPIAVISSTISDNVATGSCYAGLYVNHTSELSVLNSTIAGNAAHQLAEGCFGAGLRLGSTAMHVHLVSSIVAGNYRYEGGMGIPSDIGGALAELDFLSGDHNLIFTSMYSVPSDTLQVQPNLAPLADNGGPTRTRALMPGSPGLDAGVANNQAFDQRGEGFPRVQGAAADIGAFETPGDEDLIFENGFDKAIDGP